MVWFGFMLVLGGFGQSFRGNGVPFAVARAEWVAPGVMVLKLVVLVPAFGGLCAAVASSVPTGVSFILLRCESSRALRTREWKESMS